MRNMTRYVASGSYPEFFNSLVLQWSILWQFSTLDYYCSREWIDSVIHNYYHIGLTCIPNTQMIKLMLKWISIMFYNYSWLWYRCNSTKAETEARITISSSSSLTYNRHSYKMVGGTMTNITQHEISSVLQDI